MTIVLICVLISLLASLMLVPLVRALARVLGLVDHPDRERKLQRHAVSLGGGVAVYLAMVVAFVATLLIDRAYFGYSLGYVTPRWYQLFLAAAAILAVGLIDDAYTLRGRQKLLLQCLIVVGLVGSGTVIEAVNVLGVKLELGVFAFPLSVLWLLIAVNALNLIDGADGMATTAGCIICLGLGFLGMHSGSTLSAIVGFALAGALMGFFVFNRPPATIYLGDAGSMMIGLFVGVLAIWSNLKESTVLASAPIAILAIPLFDSTVAILRRWLTGRSIYTTDRAHLHHLLEQKYGETQMLLLVAALCGTTTSLAVLSIRYELPWLAVVGMVLVFSLLIATRSFGHAECSLLMGRAAHFAQSLARNPAAGNHHHRSVPMQGIGRWETVWEPLVQFAQSHNLAMVKIDLNLAWLQEGYHANWQSVHVVDRSLQLTLSLPLFAWRNQLGRRVQIGRLQVIAPGDAPDVYERLAHLSDQLVDLAPEIDRIVNRLEDPHEVAQAATATTDAQSQTEEGHRVVGPQTSAHEQPEPESSVFAATDSGALAASPLDPKGGRTVPFEPR